MSSDLNQVAKMTPEQKKMAKFVEWNLVLQEALRCKLIIEKEQALRKEVMALFFPEPVEGVNSTDLPEGWKLKGTHKIERKVDEAAWSAIKEQLMAQGFPADTLIRYKPEVETKAYKALSEDVKKLFEHALTIKPGSPTLELVPPKAPK